MAADAVDFEAMPQALQLLCRAIAEHGKVMQVRRGLADTDSLRASEKDASGNFGENSRAWDEAVACLRKVVAWKPFPPAEEAQWQRLERVRSAKLRLIELKNNAAAAETNGEEHSVQLRGAQSNYSGTIEAFLNEFVEPSKEDMEKAAEQASKYAGEASSVFKVLGGDAEVKASAAIPEAAQLREVCKVALQAADVWRAKHDPRGQENARAATDRMANLLRNAGPVLFFVDPADVTESQRRDLETALETFQRELALAGSSAQERPQRVLMKALRCVDAYCKDLARCASKMDAVCKAFRKELQSLAGPDGAVRTALSAVFPAPGTLQARAELEQKRARLVRALAGQPSLAEHGELLLDTVTALEGGVPLQPRPEIMLSAAPWAPDEEEPAAVGEGDPVPAPLSRTCGLGLEGARVTTVAERAPLRPHPYVVLRLDLRVDRKLSRPLLLPREPFLLQAEKVFLDGHELCLAFRSVRNKSIDVWLQEMQPALPPFAVGRRILQDVLTALVPMHKGGRAHGGVAADNVFINDARRATVGLPAPPGGPLLSARADMRSVACLAKRLTGGLKLSDEVRAALESFCEEAPTLSALQGLEHCLFEHGLDIKHDCVVCFDTKPEASGLKCSTGEHFICDRCFGEHLKTQSEAGRSAALQQHDGGVCCVAPGCGSTPFHLKTVVEHVEEEIVNVYRTALKREAEAALMHKVNVERDKEINRILNMRGTELSIERHVKHIVERILTLKCPNGHAFVDFSGCFALKCSTCSSFFCGFCLAGCRNNNDAHQHVAACPEGSRTVWGGNMEAFNKHHAGRRDAKAAEYWKIVLSEGNDIARAVRSRVLPMMRDLEMRSNLPLS